MTAHIETQRTDHQIPIATACRALNVSESWFYKHRNRSPTPSCRRRDALDAAIVEVFAANDGEYGSPRVHADLIERPEWEQLSVNTVAERMQALDLVGKKRRRRRSLTGPDPSAPKFENLIRRDFQPAGTERDVVWRHHRDQDLGRQAVSRDRDRLVLETPHQFRDR